MTRLFWTEKCCLTLLYFSTWASDNNFYLEKITLSKNFQKIPSWSWCYKTFFGGNLDFPKIKKLNKVGSDDWTYTKMLKQCYLKLNYIRTLLSCSKMANSCCFSLGENLDFLDFLQKKFYNINYRCGFHGQPNLTF